MSRPGARPVLRAALLAGLLTLIAAPLARSQNSPPPAAPAPTSPAPVEEAPPAATQVPTVVAPTPTPEAPSQDLAPAPPPPGAKPSAGKSDEDKPSAPPPIKRTLYSSAIIQALDKVTAESLRFEVQVRKPVRYKGLIFILHTCETTQSTGQQTAFAHLEIDSQPQPLPGRPPNPTRLVFKGWMAADAPGLHPLEHPVYDAWLIACKTGPGPASAASR
jgi:hypothetical protein